MWSTLWRRRRVCEKRIEARPANETGVRVDDELSRGSEQSWVWDCEQPAKHVRVRGVNDFEVWVESKRDAFEDGERADNEHVVRRNANWRAAGEPGEAFDERREAQRGELGRRRGLAKSEFEQRGDRSSVVARLGRKEAKLHEVDGERVVVAIDEVYDRCDELRAPRGRELSHHPKVEVHQLARAAGTQQVAAMRVEVIEAVVKKLL
mmetsp:Transcript_10823/g.28992  ORF Transcript_10823/g.28992 Transcript_10823/m.28992 type:complete len:207 (-) Transcript_10823:845-1465(-)